METKSLKIEATTNLYETIIPIFQAVEEKVNDSDFIITNNQIGAVLRENPNFIKEIDITIIQSHSDYNLYKTGKIKNLEIYLDARLPWTDTRILFYKDNELKEELKINSTVSLV